MKSVPTNHNSSQLCRLHCRRCARHSKVRRWSAVPASCMSEGAMTLTQARRWLGLYFLVTTSLTGAIILLFGGGTIVPLEEKDVTSSFQIVIPVLLGQLAVIFQWLGRQEESSKDQPCPVPDWAIRTPPILGAIIMLAAIMTLVLSNQQGTKWIKFGPSRFQATLTFVVGLLNASTVVLVGRLFPSSPTGKGETQSNLPTTPTKS
jgi:hypothetical protein